MVILHFQNAIFHCFGKNLLFFKICIYFQISFSIVFLIHLGTFWKVAQYQNQISEDNQNDNQSLPYSLKSLLFAIFCIILALIVLFVVPFLKETVPYNVEISFLTEILIVSTIIPIIFITTHQKIMEYIKDGVFLYFQPYPPIIY